MTGVLYAGGLLPFSEGNLSMELRGKCLGESFDFVYEVVADAVLEPYHASFRVGILSMRILVFFKCVIQTISRDLLTNRLALS